MHVYDARYPTAPGARLMPPDALPESYRSLQLALGLERCVVVTPSTHGFDNRCTMEAVRQLGQSGFSARGIAVLPPDIDASTLQDLHAAGFRGARFNQTLGHTAIEDLEGLAERIAPLGWHVELLLPEAAWPGIESRLRALPVPYVFDHFGRLPYPGARHPAHRTMLSLLATGRAWVKLSGAYLQGVEAAEWSADAAEMAEALIATASDRLVWGSNWPHPSVHGGHHVAPSETESIAALRRWTHDDDSKLQAILVDNPAILYDF